MAFRAAKEKIYCQNALARFHCKTERSKVLIKIAKSRVQLKVRRRTISQQVRSLQAQKLAKAKCQIKKSKKRQLSPSNELLTR